MRLLLDANRAHLQHVSANPSKIGKIAKATLVLTHFEHSLNGAGSWRAGTAATINKWSAERQAETRNPRRKTSHSPGKCGSQTPTVRYTADAVDGILRLSLSDLTGPVNIGNPQGCRCWADLLIR